MSSENLTAKQLYDEGNEFLINDNYDEAVECYSKAIEKSGAEELDLLYEIYLARSQTYYKLKNGQSALNDAVKAQEIKSDEAKGFLRRGMALFLLDRYEEALKLFNEGSKRDASGLKKSLFTDWITKCEAKLPPSPPSPPAEAQPKAEQQKVEETNQQEPAKPPAVKHEWYQTESTVTVSILVKGLNSDDVKTNITNRNLQVFGQKEETAHINVDLALENDIVPEATSIKFLANKIEIKLKKAEGIQWKKLEANKSQPPAFQAVTVAAVPAQPEFKPNYPTSSKKPKNWDKLVADITAEEKDEKLEGDAALNKLFKDIYANGSEETRRAMNKSFVESGGTVLSTNWKDIGPKKLDVKAPDGLEWKKWDS